MCITHNLRKLKRLCSSEVCSLIPDTYANKSFSATQHAHPFTCVPFVMKDARKTEAWWPSNVRRHVPPSPSDHILTVRSPANENSRQVHVYCVTCVQMLSDNLTAQSPGGQKHGCRLMQAARIKQQKAK